MITLIEMHYQELTIPLHCELQGKNVKACQFGLCKYTAFPEVVFYCKCEASILNRVHFTEIGMHTYIVERSDWICFPMLVIDEGAM